MSIIAIENIYKLKKNNMADQKKKILKAATFQLPPNTILLLNKYAKKENNKNKEKGERAVTKQGIVNGAILDKVGVKKYKVGGKK